MAFNTSSRRSGGTWRGVLYWLAVTVVSIALVLALLALLYAQDDSTVGAVAVGRV